MIAEIASTKGGTPVLLLVAALLAFGIARSVATSGDSATAPIRVEFSTPPAPVSQPLFPGLSPP